MSQDSSPSPDGQDQTDDDLRKQCEYLNSVRSNFTICCEYPQIVIWRWQFDQCCDQCAAQDKSGDRCCILSCCFGLMGMLQFSQSDDGNTTATFMQEGMVYSFLLSVGNDTAWLPVITASTQRCTDQFGGNDEGFDCDVIPISLYTIMDCSYNQNYLKCPTWNSYNLAACDYTYQYVQKCFVN